MGYRNETMSKLVSDQTAFLFDLIVYTALCGSVSVFGMTANIFNIIVFVRQGVFSENGSASLFGLAISDFCCVASMLWMSVNSVLVLIDPPDIPWDPRAIWYITAGWPHVVFAQITRMVTAYVTFERCVCVVLPFKVKTMLTPRRSIMIIAFIFASFIATYSPVFVSQQLQFRTQLDTNKTLLVLVSSSEWKLIESVVYYINTFVFNLSSVTIVLVCTAITVSRVKLSKAWRESATSVTTSKSENDIQPKRMSKSKMQKEKKLIRMITFISMIFLICYTPILVFLVMFSINSEISVTGRYANLANVMYSLMFLMETINSSINIFVYYDMSSRYKEQLRLLLGLRECKI